MSRHPLVAAIRLDTRSLLAPGLLLLMLGVAGPARAVEVGVLYGSTFWTDDLVNLLDAQPDIDVTTFSTCDAATLGQFDLIWIWGNCECYDEAEFDAYVSGGGGLVANAWAMGNYGLDQAYFPFYSSSRDKHHSGTLEAVVVDPTDPLLDGVTFNPGDPAGYEDYSGHVVRGGAVVPVTRNDGDPLAARWEYGSGRAVYLNMHHITSDCDLAIDQAWGQQLALNAVYWGADALCDDADADGYQDLACGGDDCDDADPAVNPGADELCNGLDDDCDGQVDEDDAIDPLTWYLDADGDGYGDPALTEEACDLPAGHVDNGDDCDDGDAAVHPGAAEICDGEDDDCDGEVDEGFDLDGDGITECGGDCDDDDPAVLPGADEYCNGIDDDCDGEVDEDDALDAWTWYIDVDGDGYGNVSVTLVACDQPLNFVADATDCDDDAADRHPGAPETCDGEDDDCDGIVDEGAVDAGVWHADLDGDGFGDPDAPTEACNPPPGFVADATDCDDGDPGIHPGADELCNGVDDDCDGDVDEDDAANAATWYADVDGDGFGDPDSAALACDAPPHHVADATDCDDADGDVFPGADETCNGLDDDCDGEVDEDEALDALTWYEDGDGDGFGNLWSTWDACAEPPGYVANADDCDDQDPAVNPAADEACDGIDNDCDPVTNEQLDGDGDGYAVCDGDCDDADAAVSPDAEEICNGIDDDCDPATDEEGDVDGDGVSICDGDCDDGDPVNAPGNPEVCDGFDNDCDGAPGPDEVDGDGDGWLVCVGPPAGGDCDDNDPLTYPDAPEQCDGLDNDCDGDVDEDVDVDGDGDGYNACQGDCDNTDPAIYPGATELCDGVDGDCDGLLPDDEADADGDGVMGCEDDCDDDDATVFPGADEICDGVDNDCDGLLADDEDDGDGDGYVECFDPGDCDDGDADIYPGAAEVPYDGVDQDCDGADLTDVDGDGFDGGADGDDCDDEDADVNPDAAEACDDGLDNDCDGDADSDDGDCAEPADDDTTEDPDDLSGGGCECLTGGTGDSAPLTPLALIALAIAVGLRRRR